MRASGAGGAQLKETCAINASLTALGRVIAELVEAQRRGPAARHHVPYRDSRLTFLLQARPCGPASAVRVLACLMSLLHALALNRSLATFCMCHGKSSLAP